MDKDNKIQQENISKSLFGILYSDAKNNKLIVPKGDDGVGWTLNFANPFAAPIVIFFLGIGLTVQFANVYTISGFIFLVILPLIIHIFRKPKKSN